MSFNGIDLLGFNAAFTKVLAHKRNDFVLRTTRVLAVDLNQLRDQLHQFIFMRQNGFMQFFLVSGSWICAFFLPIQWPC